MDKIILTKSRALSGNVEISGSKNAVLPLLAATLLTDEECTIMDVPVLKDVEVMCELLRSLGAQIGGEREREIVTVETKKISTNEASYELVSLMRASILAMGPLLARTGRARMPLPGGCAIGERPVNLHLKGFHALGADVEKKEDESGNGYIEAIAERLTGGEIYLDTPSVGATENIIMAAALADGLTVIENAAQEPEIVDLANYLNKMGARIKGAGTDTIKIEGVEKLHGAKHAVIPDRVEAGTYMLATAITRGDVTLTNMLPNHVIPVIAKLRECGVRIEDTETGFRVRADKEIMKATDIKTMPYPGFPTDIQPQFMAFLTTVSGSSTILETVFEDRFKHIQELNKMHANIIEDGRRAIIPGGSILKGASVEASDLRAGAALILAGLAAEGETEISNVHYIDRGYTKLVEKFTKLGAEIRREG